jgi:hypothetical protein
MNEQEQTAQINTIIAGLNLKAKEKGKKRRRRRQVTV